MSVSLERQLEMLQIDRDSAWANVHILERARQAQDAHLAAVKDAVAEVIRISDRRHDAWDRVKELLKL